MSQLLSDTETHAPTHRRRPHLSGIVATLAMGSWVVLAAMPVAVLIAALT